MIMQGMSQIREAYFISFRGEINQKNMEERENEMKQKKTGISAEKKGTMDSARKIRDSCRISRYLRGNRRHDFRKRVADNFGFS